MGTNPDRKFSYSSMSTFRRCRQKFYWSYVRDLFTFPGMGQVRGSVGHHALATWYLTKNAEKAMEAASEKLTEYELLFERQMDDEWEFIALVLSRYFEWALANDDFTVEATEQRFDLAFRGHNVVGYIDGIAIRQDGSQWLLEHKFQKQARTKHLDLDMQSSIYIWAARTLGYEVRGVLYNVIRMAKGGIAEREPVVRMPVFRNNEGLSLIAREADLQIQEMKALISGDFSVYRNPTSDCSWDCGFYKACLGLMDSGKAEAVLDTYPIKPHDSDVDEDGEGDDE